MQARRNGWVVREAYALSFFEIRGRQLRNHDLLPRGGTAVTAGCVENCVCYTRIFLYNNIWTVYTTCRMCLVVLERASAMSHVGLFHLHITAIPVCVTRKWKKMVNKLRRRWSLRRSRSILWPSSSIWRRGRGLKNNRAPRKAKRESMHSAHHMSWKWKVYRDNCNFQLILLEFPL